MNWPSRADTGALSSRQGLAYGLLGLPLAMVMLVLYVYLPHDYASRRGLSLASVGLWIMGVRLVDALSEPLLGRLSDRLYANSLSAVLAVGALCAALQWLALAGLLLAPPLAPGALGLWLAGGLALASLAHGQLTIAHQAWGVRLGGDSVQRSRIVAWREGAGIGGVLLASALMAGAAAALTLPAIAAGLALGWLAWRRAPRPLPGGDGGGPARAAHPPLPGLWRPLAEPGFRRLLAVFICNGTAGAIPAALMLFFSQDRLQASAAQTAGFLMAYFLAGAASLPLWLRSIRRFGLERSWLAAMLAAVGAFAWAALLDAGQVAAFAVVCCLSGVVLGADLAVPGALLARLLARVGAQGSAEGSYLGWWNLATKLNLALAAGGALPLLQWLGYVPGVQDAQALDRLAYAYALLPCALKLLAALLLYRMLIRPSIVLQPAGVTP